MVENLSQECKSMWHRCLAIIRDNVDETAFNTWFLPIVPIAIENNTLVLELPSHAFYEWIEGNYIQLLKQVIKRELGVAGKLQYRIVMQKKENQKSKMINLPSRGTPKIENPEQKIPIDTFAENSYIPSPNILPGLQRMRIPSNLSESLNFDNFVEGDCNRLLRNVGWAIAKDPKNNIYNPLFISSAVGLGKTHLVNAIGLETKGNHPDTVVLYVNADIFYSQYMESVKNNNIHDFIFFYRNIDVLIIDDIQFISGKIKTQEAFFQIFDYLLLRKKQVIITADKDPTEIVGFEDRILNRFKWGVCDTLQVPDLETRIAILNKMLEQNGIEFPPEVIEYMAIRINTNIRELKGSMIALIAQASLNNKEITVELATMMIDKYVKASAKEITIEYIQKMVSDYFRIPVETINENSRKRELVLARQLCMYFSKKYTKMPYSTIGLHCGKRDHATVLYSCRNIENLCETDKQVKKYVSDIEKKIKI